MTGVGQQVQTAQARVVGATPTVSVCMPVSRPAMFFRRALGSVLAQDFDDFEVLIGDDAGLVGAAVDDIDDPRVHYERRVVPLGIARNHVALLDRAVGRYVAVLHDDDCWEPSYLSSLVSALETHPEVGMACCGTLVDRGPESSVPWPVPLEEGSHHDLIELLLREDWFLLPTSTMWRRELWTGPARQWPDLSCGDLQFFLSAADAGWGLHYLPRVLAHRVQHDGQVSAWRGPDHGLRAADDVLAFWGWWLEGRPDEQVELTNRQRARWHLRRARALLLAGRSPEARAALARASELRHASGIARPELPGLRRLTVSSRLPSAAVRVGVNLKRCASTSGGHQRAWRIRSALAVLKSP